MNGRISTCIKKHEEAVRQSFGALQLRVLDAIAREVLNTFKNGHKLLFCGNGGSAADSQHMATEFMSRFRLERKSLPAIALTTDTSILTAIGNDYDFDRVFARQIEGLGVKGDLLIALSTSGNSKNVLRAVERARAMEIKVVAFTGAGGGKLKPLADICFEAATPETPHVQEVHITALHALAEAVENVLFGS